MNSRVLRGRAWAHKGKPCTEDPCHFYIALPRVGPVIHFIYVSPVNPHSNTKRYAVLSHFTDEAAGARGAEGHTAN